MQNDEEAIRDVLAKWRHAAANGDLPQLLNLMAEDVVFLRPGEPPMRGRDAFAAEFSAGAGQYRIGSDWKEEEIRVEGNIAYCQSYLDVTITLLHGGAPSRRAGSVLSILERQDSGWVVIRDANMLMPEQGAI